MPVRIPDPAELPVVLALPEAEHCTQLEAELA